MRQPRNFATDRCYHLVSRIANRAFYLSEEERTRFVERMWRVAYFSCVDILAYCVMDNHFTAQYLTPMRKAGYIAQVGEANPHSPRQKYRITAKGRREIANG